MPLYNFARKHKKDHKSNIYLVLCVKCVLSFKPEKMMMTQINRPNYLLKEWPVEGAIGASKIK